MDHVAIDGLNIAYRTAGAGRPLVLLHGGISDSKLRIREATLAVPAGFLNDRPRQILQLRAPKLVTFDLSALKTFPIRESKRLEFRAEFFNIANNVNFLPPEAAAGEGTFHVRTRTGAASVDRGSAAPHHLS